MKKFIESIQILSRFANEISNRALLIIEFGFAKTGFNISDNKMLTLLNSLFYMTIIDSISYIDEYEGIFGVKTESEFNERIIIVKSINKPFITKIKEWKELRDIRNQVFAHNLRIGKNGIYIFSRDRIDYNAPTSINDLFLLSNLIQLSYQTINSEFYNEVKTFDNKHLKEIRTFSNFITKEEVSSITSKLIIEANKVKEKHNRNYKYSVSENIDWSKV